ncbi:MAG TPA: hypothetical protein VM784_02050 [Actinomycetota bacterium]|nr:hypothetical protein [Actinomycetota bacterium]
MSQAADLVRRAIKARTYSEAVRIQDGIGRVVRGEHQRPLGDRWKNIGLVSGSGSFDHNVLENVTNMQDAVLELLAVVKHGDLSRVPYATPHEAAENLLAGVDPRTVADMVSVDFFESDPPTGVTKRLTPVFRDKGVGLTPLDVPKTMLALGASHKDDLHWLQGAFGVGAKYTFRNARSVIVVTRRDPRLLRAGEEDRIAVAVVLWEQHGKTSSAYYLVTEKWKGEGHNPPVFSVPASIVPEFEPGTHLALVSYGVDGFHRKRGGDERSFDTILNTRLFRPVTPVMFTNNITRGRNEFLAGLERRFSENPSPDRPHGSDVLPFRMGSETYHLPVQFWVFAKSGDAGERRSFVAHDHVLCFTSNGQVHKHWGASDFRVRTRLNKLPDRVLVVVETDNLPIAVRTSLFTADRASIVPTEEARRLEQDVIGFLNEWPELVEINNQLIRDAISGADERSTINVAMQIARALKVKGFSFEGQGSGGGKGGGGRGGKRPKRPVELYKDPTTLEGPELVVAEAGKTKFVTFSVNAIDGFIPRRAQLSVACDHPDLQPKDIVVGDLRGGYVRVSIAIPDDAEYGMYKLDVTLEPWIRSDGGLAKAIPWTTKLEVVKELSPRNGNGKDKGKKGAGDGGLVAVLWEAPEHRDEWDDKTVGEIDYIEGSILAEKRPDDYGMLKDVSDEIPTVVINKDNTYLKSYIGARERDMARGADEKRDQYAVGVGVGLLEFENVRKKAEEKGKALEPSVVKAAGVSVGRAVLSIMPAYDRLAREAGIEE